jgi:hypothetical protein
MKNSVKYYPIAFSRGYKLQAEPTLTLTVTHTLTPSTLFSPNRDVVNTNDYSQYSIFERASEQKGRKRLTKRERKILLELTR